MRGLGLLHRQCVRVDAELIQAAALVPAHSRVPTGVASVESHIDDVPVEDDLSEWSTPILRRAALEDTAFGSGELSSDLCNASASLSNAG